jgi:uncharacterized protein YtpQ (UPF0354 family)
VSRFPTLHPLVLVAVLTAFTALAKPPADGPALSKDLQVQLAGPFLTEESFTALCLKAAQAFQPKARITTASPLTLRVEREGSEMLVNLDNAWRASPEERPEAVSKQLRLIESSLQVMKKKGPAGRLEDIVPLVRGGEYARVQGGLSEPLAGDLWVVYAYNLPEMFVPVRDVDLKTWKLSKAQLRARAVENLRRQLPPVEREGGKGRWMFVAGGNFEASLLMVDSVWKDIAPHITGDPVVAVPARELVFVTGSRDAEGLETVRAIATDAFSKVEYPLSPRLLIRRGGKWEALDK